MNRIKRNLVIDNFLETTSIHGVSYLNDGNRKVKILFILMISISAILTLTATTYYSILYFEYGSFIINEEKEIDSFDALPSILICSYEKFPLSKSIIDLKPKFKEFFDLLENHFPLSANPVDFYRSVDKYKIQNISSNYKKQKLDYDFINDLKETKQHPFIKECVMKIKNQIIDCTNLEERIVFSFNGFCLLHDLNKLNLSISMLNKDVRLLNYENDYKIEVNILMNNQQTDQVNENGNEKNALSFHLLNLDHRNKDNYFENFDINDRQVLSFRKVFNDFYHLKNYDVYQKITKYSTSLYNRKCSHENDYNQISCHSKCLRAIIKQTLDCDFILNPIKNKSNYCTIADLYFIERIIESYSVLKKDFTNTCKPCLPECQTNKFEAKELLNSNSKSKDLRLNLYLNYKAVETKHILRFEWSQFLNYITGFWSLFFGISVLSIFEIIELIGALAYGIRLKTKLAKKNSKLETIFQSKPFQILNIIFQDSEIHGVPKLFSGKAKSALIKLRWIIFLGFSLIALAYSISAEISVYLRYDSDFEKTSEILKHNQELSNRTLTFFFCGPLTPRDEWKDLFDILNDKAEKLFENLNDLDHINEVFRNLIIPYTGQNQLHYNYSSVLNLYFNMTFNLTFDFSVYTSLNIELFKNIESKRNFDKSCQFIETNTKIKQIDSHEFLTGIVTHSDDNQLKNVEKIYILDSKSKHFVKSNLDIDDSTIVGHSALDKIYIKYKSKIPSPYKPSCNPDANYSQHECINDCYNNIIFHKFGCKVVFYETKNDSFPSYCHPLMLPLITSFKKHVLTNNNTLCSHCNEPCEVFYYDTDIKEKDYVYDNDHYTFLLDNIMKSEEQVKIRTLYDTFMVIISFFGLFFGCSLLNLIQIPYNFSKIKNKKSATVSNEKKFKKELINSKLSLVFQYLAKLKSVNCSKYLSTKYQDYEGFKIYFWFITILLAVILGLFLSFNEVINNSNSKEIFLLTDSDEDKLNLWFPKIDFCIEKNHQNILENYILFERFLTTRYYVQDYSDNLNVNVSSNVISLIQLLYTNEETKFIFLDGVQDELKNIKLSDIYNKEADSLNFKLMNTIPSFGSKITNSYSSNNLSVGTFQTSLLFSDYYIEIIQCKTVNWSLFNRSENFRTNNNPFIKLSRNQVSFSKNEFALDELIYFEKYRLLRSDSNIANIKSIIVNNDHKRECKGDKAQCVNKFPSIEELTEYQLFLCNSNFQRLTYETFNCTPFYSSINNNHLNECPFSITLLIYEVMVEFKKDLFNCEYSKIKFPIRFNIESHFSNDASSHSGFKDQFTGVDFNGMKVYEKSLKSNGPSSFELIVNIANILGLCFGFSVFAIYELVYILSSFKTPNKVDQKVELNQKH